MKILYKKPHLLLIFGILLTIISPWLLTQTFNLNNFSLDESSNIGSTIGGITAPIVSILGSILLYFAFIAQKDANEIQISNSEQQIILSLLIELNTKCENYEYIHFEGNEKMIFKGLSGFNFAFRHLLFRDIKEYFNKDKKTNESEVLTVVNFANYFNIISDASLILSSIKNLKSKKNQIETLDKKLFYTYSIFLKKSLKRLIENYENCGEKDYYLEELKCIKTSFEEYYKES